MRREKRAKRIFRDKRACARHVAGVLSLAGDTSTPGSADCFCCKPGSDLPCKQRSGCDGESGFGQQQKADKEMTKKRFCAVLAGIFFNRVMSSNGAPAKTGLSPNLDNSNDALGV